MAILEAWHGGKYSVILWQASQCKFEVTIYSNDHKKDHISKEFKGSNQAKKCFGLWIARARKLDKKS